MDKEYNPSFDCLPNGHIVVMKMVTPEGHVYGWWCAWCGTGAGDPTYLNEG